MLGGMLGGCHPDMGAGHLFRHYWEVKAKLEGDSNAPMDDIPADVNPVSLPFEESKHLVQTPPGIMLTHTLDHFDTITQELVYYIYIYIYSYMER